MITTEVGRARQLIDRLEQESSDETRASDS